ncbi:Uncharacterised protein [Klebsiella pneumoniae]|nr:Uncharacterised protein [Klebsiella pneumoniae]
MQLLIKRRAFLRITFRRRRARFGTQFRDIPANAPRQRFRAARDVIGEGAGIAVGINVIRAPVDKDRLEIAAAHFAPQLGLGDRLNINLNIRFSKARLQRLGNIAVRRLADDGQRKARAGLDPALRQDRFGFRHIVVERLVGQRALKTGRQERLMHLILAF